jgi:TRAP-type C4-dicarboxylate transport system substrate-binding protein
MKLRKICAILLVIAMTLAVVACGSSGETTGKVSETTDKPETKASDKPETNSSDKPETKSSDEVYELSFSMHDGGATLKYKYTLEWADNLKKATNGRLKITIFPGAALASADTVVEAIESGACDLGMVYTTYYDTIFGLTNGVALPMLGIGSAQEATEVMWDMYEQSPEMKAEFDDYVPIHIYSNGPSYFHFVNKPINTFDGLKGLKMRAGGGSMTQFLTKCGAAPMNVTTPELYEALQKGMIDGNVCNGSQMASWNLSEVEKYFMDMPLFVGVWMTLMNKDSFEKLPADIQEALLSSGGREGSLVLADYLQGENDSGYKEAIAKGCEWVDVADKEVAKFNDAAVSYNKEWIKSHTTAKFDAQAYYDMLMASAQKHKK